MNMTLKRTMFRDDGIFGELTGDGGQTIATTLEHSYDLKPKIPDGVYTCVRGTHALHDGVPFITFEITGVEGHSGLLFHQLNYNEESDGCVGLGKRLGWRLGGKTRMITFSKQAFEEFMELQKYVDSFELTVQS